MVVNGAPTHDQPVGTVTRMRPPAGPSGHGNSYGPASIVPSSAVSRPPSRGVVTGLGDGADAAGASVGGIPPDPPLGGDAMPMTATTTAVSAVTASADLAPRTVPGPRHQARSGSPS